MTSFKNKCDHTLNNYLIYCDCCDKYFSCFKCHNENSDHIVTKKNITRFKCLNCKFENKLDEIKNNKCENCNQELAKFICKICVLGQNKEIFHCEKCDLCFSEKNRNHKCYPYFKEKCKEDCSICLEKLGLCNIIKLNCSHIFHKNCIQKHVDNIDKRIKVPFCPLCKKSCIDICKYEIKFDKLKKEYLTEYYYNNWTCDINCYDCSKKSNIKYHPKYNKCIECKSYNTRIEFINK